MRASRMDWVAAIDIAIPPLPAAVGRAAASMQTESPSWSSWRHDGALPLLVSRRAEPTAQPLVHETSTRAVDPSHVSVCELKKLGRAIRLLNSNVACSRIFLVSQSLTSWHRACSAQSAVALNTNLGHIGSTREAATMQCCISEARFWQGL